MRCEPDSLGTSPDASQPGFLDPCFSRLNLSWRPLHLPAPEYVKMKMLDRLATMLVCIGHNAVAWLGKALIARNTSGEEQETAKLDWIVCVVE